jgi:hypothetical protein
MTTVSAVERIGNDVYEYGIASEAAGYRIMLRTPTSAWESACMGRHSTMKEAETRLGKGLAVSRFSVEITSDGVRAAYDAAIAEQARRAEALRREAEARDEQDRLEAERRAAIDAAFAGAKFRKTTFQCAMRDAKLDGTTTGSAIGGLIVHTVAESHRRTYRVSHLASGLSLGLDFAMLCQAKMAAFRLSQAADWTRDAKAIKADKALARLVAALRVDPYGDFGTGPDQG